jgi:hypothetical protein
MPDIICPKCAMNIPAAAEICPYCKTRIKTSAITKLISIIIGLFCVALFFTQCINPSPPPPVTEEKNPFVDISRTLVAKKITGCGVMEWRLVPGQRSEYKVKCSPDGKNWRFYTVWPNINEITAADSY